MGLEMEMAMAMAMEMEMALKTMSLRGDKSHRLIDDVECVFLGICEIECVESHHIESLDVF